MLHSREFGAERTASEMLPLPPLWKTWLSTPGQLPDPLSTKLEMALQANGEQQHVTGRIADEVRG
jgi:hypothetical protein